MVIGMKLIPALFQNNLFTLLTAPVARGKTHSILEYYRDQRLRMIFVSPLRALAQEVYEKLKSEGEKNVYILGGKNQNGLGTVESCLNFLRKDRAMLITTMEMLENEFLEMIKDDDRPTLFVLDEFHLFYTWGEGFRPILHDQFLGILMTEKPVIGLSATMNSDVLKRLERDLSFHDEQWIHLDFGNLELFRAPSKVICFKGHEKLTLERTFFRELQRKKHDQVMLMFCKYRTEVDEKVEWAKRLGFKALGCVGGEVEQFQNHLKNSITQNEKVDCIFSTSTLSHGVNLPEIKKVFINYEVNDFDFWLQMIGRGGRKGNPYEVYSFDQFHKTKSEIFKNYITVGISDWVGIEF
jgi:ATP-dependent DNA helicase RecQ